MRHQWIASPAFVCLTLLSLFCPPSSGAIQEIGPWPEFVTGRWTGVGYQDSGDTWTITLVAKSGTATVTVAYPSLRCGGTWSFVKGHRHLAWFRERITHGKKACLDGGMIAVTPIEANYLTFSYFQLDDGRLASWSTLRKADAVSPMPPNVLPLPEPPTDVRPEPPTDVRPPAK